MKVLFPRYDDFKPHWQNETYEREVDENNYFKSLDDFKAYINRYYPSPSIETCEDIKSQILVAIEANKGIKFLVDDLVDFKKSNIPLISSYPIGEIRDYWKAQNDLLIQEFKLLMAKNNKYIKDNKDIVISFLDEQRDTAIRKIQENRKEVNRRYYEKRKMMLSNDNKTAKSVLTEEERKLRKQIANKKYYEKRKLAGVTPPDATKTGGGFIDEVPSSSPAALGQKPLLTEEEKREHRREANKKYYQKKKKVILEIVENEIEFSEVSGL